MLRCARDCRRPSRDKVINHSQRHQDQAKAQLAHRAQSAEVQLLAAILDQCDYQQRSWTYAESDCARQTARHTKWAQELRFANTQYDQRKKFEYQTGAVK